MSHLSSHRAAYLAAYGEAFRPDDAVLATIVADVSDLPSQYDRDEWTLSDMNCAQHGIATHSARVAELRARRAA